MRHTVERQSLILGIHINPYSVGAGNRDFPSFVIVSKTTLAKRTLQAPGQVIVSQNNISTTIVSPNPWICDSDINPILTRPLHLPICRCRQAVLSQHLIIEGKSLRKIRIGQRLITPRHLSVAIRKPQMVVCRVYIQ